MRKQTTEYVNRALVLLDSARSIRADFVPNCRQGRAEYERAQALLSQRRYRQAQTSALDAASLVGGAISQTVRVRDEATRLLNNAQYLQHLLEWAGTAKIAPGECSQMRLVIASARRCYEEKKWDTAVSAAREAARIYEQAQALANQTVRQWYHQPTAFDTLKAVKP